MKKHNRLKKIIEKIAIRAAISEANTTCPFINYQPEIPKAVKKIKEVLKMSIQIEQLSEEEREEIINYGIRRSIVISISTIVTIMAGYLLGIVWQSIFFLFCFSALRKYAGGYHADTPIRCYFLSFITLFIALMGIKILQCDDNVGILIQTINLLIIIFLSPIDSVVHRLEYEEKKEYGTRAKKIALIYYVLYCILKKASIVYISTPIAVACSMVGISLIGGYIKYRKVAMSTE